MSVAVVDIQQALLPLTDPSLNQPLIALGAAPAVTVEQGLVKVQLTLGYAAAGVAGQLAHAVNDMLAPVSGISAVEVDIQWEIPAAPVSVGQQVPGVRNIIAVASGKGGVGKSTTAVNLALALAAEGARTGILDADIYGPSVPQMLGVGSRRPEVVGELGRQQMLPLEAHGIQSISMGYLVTEQTPMVWRGPMATGALKQLLTQTRWDDLDYLVVDMPPGTGDIQLTLSQSVAVSGAVIVTTPQDIALLDAKKGIEMFRKVNIPVLGVVENMAVHVCRQCGHEEPVFGSGGGERIARDYQTHLLGALPLDLSIREQADSGCPTVAADPDSALAQHYRSIARQVGAILWQQAGTAAAGPSIEIVDD